MSSNVRTVVVESDDRAHFEEVWNLKEEIRRQEGVLRQRRRFFARAYEQSTGYLARDDEDVVGFAVVRPDGYLLFLGVDPDHRNRGFGRRLVAAAADDHDRITCHVRASNETAIGFYRRIGFDVDREVDGYYRDGEDALSMVLEGSPRR